MFTTENITLVTPFDYLLLKAVAALEGRGGGMEGRGWSAKELNDDSEINKKLKNKKIVEKEEEKKYCSQMGCHHKEKIRVFVTARVLNRTKNTYWKE